MPPTKVSACHDGDELQLTFKERRDLSEDVPGKSDLAQAIESFPERQASFAISVVLVEELIQELRSIVTVVVECQSTATMLVHVDVVYPHSKQRIWDKKEPWHSTPGLYQMQEACEEQRQTNSPPEFSTRLPRVSGPDDTVIVLVKPDAMLLEDLHSNVSKSLYLDF